MEDVIEIILRDREFNFAVEAVIRRELVKNFQEGGRYGSGLLGGGRKKWKPSKRAIRQAGRTLIDTGNLFNAVGGGLDLTKKEIVLNAHNVPYAIFLQEGTRKMEARPFLTLPDLFIDEFAKIFEKTSHKVMQDKIVDWLQKRRGF